ncbi:D-arabinono-1,4-lactone oxidase [Kineococcus rubinsiae]|uniref:D-arabinono-1,4-lactone oxidase n=1 Tax=Kineococcus rubinsiae TaxID=2609562 RepID=UPI0014320D24|nr:D-arabinono-1,4-lactone oxidase [Kineococcus rubinsiae]NIZ90443.1 FAD-binding protein [Kineococcus rubinsiae]
MTGTRWRNWSRTVEAAPATVAVPRDEAEVAAVVARAAATGRTVRPLGSGHSGSPVAAGDDVCLRLTHLDAVRPVDLARGLVAVGAGTRLDALSAALLRHGLAVANLGDIDRQTLAGALATGTHGTGAAHPSLAGGVRALRMVLADGSVATCSPRERPELFAAALVGLGAYGVVTEVLLHCPPAFLLAADEHLEPLDAVLDGFEQRMTATDHVEFYWFPHTGAAMVKENTRRPLSAGAEPLPRWRALLDDEVVANGLFAATCAAGTLLPGLVPTINRLSTRAVSRRRYTDLSHGVFTSRRRVRFREMEYALPRADLPEVLREVRRLIDLRGWRLPFPLEARVSAPEDAWLSPGHGRATAWLSVQQVAGAPFVDYLTGVEEVLVAAQGRPHWGKLHTRTARDLAPLYPRFADAQRVREAVDPAGTFASGHLDRVLGRPATAAGGGRSARPGGSCGDTLPGRRRDVPQRA